MKFDFSSTGAKSFLLTTAICAVFSVVTTLTLIHWPVNASISINNAKSIHDSSYLFYSCIYLLHPFVNIVAVLGIAYAKFKFKPGWILLGFLFFFFWAFTEALQQSLSIVANNLTWRAQYLAADNEAAKQVLEFHMDGFLGVYDAMFFLLLIGFCLGNLFYGIAFLGKSPLDLVLACLFFVVSFITLAGVVDYGGIKIDYLGWSYKYVQPLLRMLIAVWLFMQARKLSANTEA